HAAEDAGVVDEGVHAAVAGPHSGDHGLHLRLVGDVAGEAEGPPPALDDPLRALARVVLGHVHAGNGGAFVGEALGDAPTDIGTRARDDGDLAGELAHSRLSAATGRRGGDLSAPTAAPRRT